MKIVKADITKLDEIESPQKEKGEFDAISCASALVLLQDPVAALQKWEDCLKPGGRIIVNSTHRDNLPAGTAFERVYARLGVEAPFYRDWARTRGV